MTKVRQKEEFQKEATKNLHSQRKNAKRKIENIIFSQREETFFTKQFNQVERVRNISWRNFPKKKRVVKEIVFCFCRFLVKNK